MSESNRPRYTTEEEALLLERYRIWSDEVYCAGFVIPSSDSVAKFRDRQGRVIDYSTLRRYEIEFLEEHARQKEAAKTVTSTIPEVAATDHALAQIASWEPKSSEEIETLCSRIADFFINNHYGGAGNPIPGLWYFTTGGWSDNEAVIGEFFQNAHVRASCRIQTLSGGWHCIGTTDDAESTILQAEEDFVELIKAGKIGV